MQTLVVWQGLDQLLAVFNGESEPDRADVALVLHVHGMQIRVGINFALAVRSSIVSIGGFTMSNDRECTYDLA